ncbi:hypothetical protein [Leptospira borgpetersenii]|uniref:Methyltransferase domain protein n=2 Tax=Leptospira borgpetersenii TaxID=174 RepID=M3HMR6_LEPBO|nr:hypothetical protein [Leptospira borgpetersenii]EKP12818.1 hypothetical protein LEP1GSC128_3371 [Leptospira borgpetersenii str. 200801926]EMF99370.1 hypothetical protein LEP1GSC123_4719 [Leptospira borgpetersenii str. 200701203]ENO65313.1 hypothetical protein LEP1GSC191_2759 [Leptospira borgpetersenii serovar Mini str. 201000851]
MISEATSLKIQDRARLYNECFPNYAPLHIFKERMYGEWELGQNYRNTSDYHGAYPEQYLKRLLPMFPDKSRILHLFSGKTPPGQYLRMDKNPDLNPEIVGDAELLSSYIRAIVGHSLDLILADPPYTEEDADHYGFLMVNRGKVLMEAWKSLEVGGHLVWLDQVVPQYAGDRWALEGKIYLSISTNHRVRVICIFRKV